MQHIGAQVRKLLRRRHGIDRGIPVVLSTEKPRCKLVDMTGGGNLADFQARVTACFALCPREIPSRNWSGWLHKAAATLPTPQYLASKSVRDVADSYLNQPMRTARHDPSSTLCRVSPLSGVPVVGHRLTSVMAVAAPAQIVPNFRVRTIPVLGTTPAFFGIAAAAHILCHLAEQVSLALQNRSRPPIVL